MDLEIGPKWALWLFQLGQMKNSFVTRGPIQQEKYYKLYIFFYFLMEMLVIKARQCKKAKP